MLHRTRIIAPWLLTLMLLPGSVSLGQPHATSHGASPSTEQCPHQHLGHASQDSSAAQHTIPASSGQEIFGAIQEIVLLLERDPATDWTRVDIAKLREHLVDMNEVAVNARVVRHELEDGLRIDVLGEGRTLQALQRMVPAHVSMMRQASDWDITLTPLEDGLRLVWRTQDPGEISKLKGLGFFGFMASGDHHRPHHLAMAQGRPMHSHAEAPR